MSRAALLSLADVRDTQRRAEIRQRLHDRCDHWLALREDRMPEQTPTVAELPHAVLVLRQEWTQEVTASLVARASRPR